MATSHIYWVKLEKGLFRKPEWTVTMNDLTIGLHKEKEAAINEAVTEAERTSVLGRTTEVWLDEGLGFTLYKAFKASKPPVEDDDDDGEGSDDVDPDDSAYL